MRLGCKEGAPPKRGGAVLLLATLFAVFQLSWSQQESGAPLTSFTSGNVRYVLKTNRGTFLEAVTACAGDAGVLQALAGEGAPGALAPASLLVPALLQQQLSSDSIFDVGNSYVVITAINAQQLVCKGILAALAAEGPAGAPPEQEGWQLWAWDAGRGCRAVRHTLSATSGQTLDTADVSCSWMLAYACVTERDAAAAPPGGNEPTSTSWLRRLQRDTVPLPSPYRLGPDASGLQLVQSGFDIGHPGQPGQYPLQYDGSDLFWRYGPVVNLLTRRVFYSYVRPLREAEPTDPWVTFRAVSQGLTPFDADSIEDEKGAELGNSNFDMLNTVPDMNDYIVRVEGCFTASILEGWRLTTRSGRHMRMGQYDCVGTWFREDAPPGGYLAGFAGSYTWHERPVLGEGYNIYRTCLQEYGAPDGPPDQPFMLFDVIRLIWAAPAGSAPPSVTVVDALATPPPAPSCPSARPAVAAQPNATADAECGPASGLVCKSDSCCAALPFNPWTGARDSYPVCGSTAQQCTTFCISGYGMCGTAPAPRFISTVSDATASGSGATVFLFDPSGLRGYAQAEAFCRSSTLLGLRWSLVTAADMMTLSYSLQARRLHADWPASISPWVQLPGGPDPAGGSTAPLEDGAVCPRVALGLLGGSRSLRYLVPNSFYKWLCASSEATTLCAARVVSTEEGGMVRLAEASNGSSSSSTDGSSSSSRVGSTDSAGSTGQASSPGGPNAPNAATARLSTGRHQLHLSRAYGSGPFGPAACPFALGVSLPVGDTGTAEQLPSSLPAAGSVWEHLSSIGVSLAISANSKFLELSTMRKLQLPVVSGIAVSLSSTANTSSPPQLQSAPSGAAVADVGGSPAAAATPPTQQQQGGASVQQVAGAASSRGWHTLQLAPGEAVVGASVCAGGYVERLVLHTSAGRAWGPPLGLDDFCSLDFQEWAPQGGYLVGLQGYMGRSFMEQVRFVWGVPETQPSGTPSPPTPSGQPAEAAGGSGGSGGSATAVAVGVGVGVAAACLVAGFVTFLIVRRRRRAGKDAPAAKTFAGGIKGSSSAQASGCGSGTLPGAGSKPPGPHEQMESGWTGMDTACTTEGRELQAPEVVVLTDAAETGAGGALGLLPPRDDGAGGRGGGGGGGTPAPALAGRGGAQLGAQSGAQRDQGGAEATSAGAAGAGGARVVPVAADPQRGVHAARTRQRLRLWRVRDVEHQLSIYLDSRSISTSLSDPSTTVSGLAASDTSSWISSMAAAFTFDAIPADGGPTAAAVAVAPGAVLGPGGLAGGEAVNAFQSEVAATAGMLQKPQGGPSASRPVTTATAAASSLSTLTNGSASPTAAAAPAQQLHLHRVLGKGSYGVVFLGTWRGLRVAVKTLVVDNTLLGQKAMRRHRALLEAAISSSIQHPNVVNTYSYQIEQLTLVEPGAAQGGQSPKGPLAPPGTPRAESDTRGALDLRGGEVYKLHMIQEFCNMGSLKDLLDAGVLGQAQHGGAPLLLSLSLALDVACGLSHIHSKNIVHGDLSAGNVLLCSRQAGGDTWSGRGGAAAQRSPLSQPSRSSQIASALLESPQPSTPVSPGAKDARDVAEQLAGCWRPPVVAKVADFGLSVALLADQTHASRRFQGTPAYMAPEVVAEGHLTKAADVWSFGVLLLELLHGRKAQDLPGGLKASVEALAAMGTAGTTGAGSRSAAAAGADASPEAACVDVSCAAEDLVAPGSQAWLALVSSCLHPSPAARPTAAQLASSLVELLQREHSRYNLLAGAGAATGTTDGASGEHGPP